MDNNFTFKIRKAKVADLKTLQQLSAKLINSDNRFNNVQNLRKWSLSEDGEKYLLCRIRGKKGACFVAEREGEIVGYISGGVVKIQKWRPFKKAEVDNIYVKENYRNHKIGSALMDIFINWAKSKGMEKVFLYAMEQNVDAIRFYQNKLYDKFQLILEREI